MVPKSHCRTSRESLHYPDGNYPIEVSRHTAYVTIRSGKNLFELKCTYNFFPKMRGLQSSKFSNIQSILQTIVNLFMYGADPRWYLLLTDESQSRCHTTRHWNFFTLWCRPKGRYRSEGYNFTKPCVEPTGILEEFQCNLHFPRS